MAYIVLSANGQEIERRELNEPLTLGRSGECSIAIHDVLMSRRHCRIEPTRTGWRILDLGSKNGTRVGWQKVQEHFLCDGEQVRMGRTVLQFHTGPLVAAPANTPMRPRTVRPADPHEALHGTVTDFVYDDRQVAKADMEDCGFLSPHLEASRQNATTAAATAPVGRDGRPFPQPQPAEPVAVGGGRRKTFTDWSLQVNPAAQRSTGNPAQAIRLTHPLLIAVGVGLMAASMMAGAILSQRLWHGVLFPF